MLGNAMRQVKYTNNTSKNENCKNRAIRSSCSDNTFSIIITKGTTIRMRGVTATNDRWMKIKQQLQICLLSRMQENDDSKNSQKEIINKHIVMSHL